MEHIPVFNEEIEGVVMAGQQNNQINNLEMARTIFY